MSLGISAAGWVALGVGAASAVGQYSASQSATNAQVKGLKAADQLAMQNRNMAYTANEPNRMLGYQALGDLSHLYGYQSPAYTTLGDLLNGTGAGGNGGTGRSSSGGGMNLADPLNLGKKVTDPLNLGFDAVDPFGLLGGGKKQHIGTQIDPATGTVTVTGDNAGYRSDMLTNYLRTGQGLNPKHGDILNSVIAQIDAMRNNGYTYTPGAAGAAGTGAYPGALAGQPAGTPGQMDRFFTSPDYQYRLGEQNKNINANAAARGGYFSPNVMSALTQQSGNLASAEYGNYLNNLFKMMGYGDTATQNVVNSGNQTTNALMGSQVAQGDVRASGVADQWGAINSALRGLGRTYANSASGLSVPDIYSQYMLAVPDIYAQRM